MSKSVRSADVKTPLARLAFAKRLFEIKTNDTGKKSWGCTLLFDKSTDMSTLKNLVVATAREAWGDKAVEMLKNGLIKNPILDGDGKQGLSTKTGERHLGFEGHYFIRTTSGEDHRPKLFDRKKGPIISPEECYSGCYVYAVVNAFTWENEKNGRGVSFGLSMLQVAKDGERLGGGDLNPDNFFETLEGGDDAPSSTKSGAGAAALFD